MNLVLHINGERYFGKAEPDWVPPPLLIEPILSCRIEFLALIDLYRVDLSKKAPKVGMKS